jgi:hypothetical protein
MEERHARPLTAEELSISRDEERLASAVRDAVRDAQSRGAGRTERLGALASLRDDFASAGEEDRPAVLAQMHEESAREAAAASRLLPDLDAPYFGHLRVRSCGRTRDVLLGMRALLDGARGVTVVDFRTAPIAEVFFSCAPGDDYAIEVDGRTVEGVVERKHVVAFEQGVIIAVDVPLGAIVRREGRFVFEPEASPVELAGGPSIVGRGAPRIAALLDEDQRALLERDPTEPLLVLGSAGSGKTTVDPRGTTGVDRFARGSVADPAAC